VTTDPAGRQATERPILEVIVAMRAAADTQVPVGLVWSDVERILDIAERAARLDPLTIETAIGGGYAMPDGRSFWIDVPVAREITRRVLAAGLGEEDRT
jgi:hypothetical protein